MKVAGYARVSTDLQRDKETIKTQVELIQRFCQEKGHTLLEIFCDDGVSGTIQLCDRPGGARLVAQARKSQFEGIVVYKADRIGRDVLVNETAARLLYDQLGIAFMGVAEQIDLSTPIGRAMFTFQSAIGRLERENTLQRSMDATLRYAREGVWLGGIVPFGYRVEGKDKDARLCIAEEFIPEIGMSEADVVREIYRMAGDEELSCIAIADRLNARGIPTHYLRDGRQVVRNKRKQRTRGVWRGGRVRNMLVETTYKGIHRWGRRGSKRRANQEPRPVIERTVPAIVDETLWQRAQETLQRNRIVPPNTEKRQYLLRGLMKCSLCGLTYVGTVSKGGKAEHLTADQLRTAEVSGGRVLRRYYMCNGKNLSHQIYGQLNCRCPSGAIRAQELEQVIWEDVEAFLRNPGAVLNQLSDKLQDRFANTDALVQVVDKLQEDIRSKEDERSSLYRLFRRGGIPETELQKQMQEVALEERVLQSEAERLRTELQKAQDATNSLSTAEQLLRRLHSKLEGELSWETKRKIVEALVERIEIESQPKGSTDGGTNSGTNGFPSSKRQVPTITVRYCFDETISGLSANGRALNDRVSSDSTQSGGTLRGGTLNSATLGNGVPVDCPVSAAAQASDCTGVPVDFTATSVAPANVRRLKSVVI